MSVKLLKLGHQAFVPHFKNLVNNTILTGIFPDKLKIGHVAPIFMKNDLMEKSNHRPISILPVPSKIYEKVLSEQLSNHFEDIFNNYLCAFRKGRDCQTT